jgi:hypothetical protein
MNRKVLKNVWIIGTVFVLSMINSIGQQNSNVSNGTLGFILFLIIVVSILVFKAVAGPKTGQSGGLFNPSYPSIDSMGTSTTVNKSIPKPHVPSVRETYEQYKGRLGEDRIVNALKPLPYNYRVLRNLLFNDENGTSSEIDLVCITPVGIYVIESKNYSGWIFGGVDQQNWTQTFANQTKNRFYNPILQNEGHIKVLKSKLSKLSDINYYSVVVFSDDASLKSVPRSEYQTMILNLGELCDTIRASIEFTMKLHKGPVLLSQNIDEIWLSLYQYTLSTEEERRTHIQKVAEVVSAKQKA